MVLPDSPVRDEGKLPVPVPADNLKARVSGLTEVLQQIPRDLIKAPPLSVTFPPPTAELLVMLVIAVVVTVGFTGAEVVKLSSLP